MWKELYRHQVKKSLCPKILTILVSFSNVISQTAHKPHPLLYTHLNEAKSQSYNLRPMYILQLHPAGPQAEPQNCPYRHLKQAQMSILCLHGPGPVS